MRAKTTSRALPLAVEGEALLAAIVDSSDDAIISKDLDGIVRSWNSGAERLFGYKPEEVIGRPVTMLALPDNAAEIPLILARIASGERVEHYETRRRTKDGRILTVSLTVSPIRDSLGRIVGASKVARNITDQKRAIEVQERLAAIVESSDDAIISNDLNGIIQTWNKGAERIFGYTTDEVVGKPVSVLAVPERRTEMYEILALIRRGERVEHYETVRQTKDGRPIFVSLTVSPVRNASGEITGASKIARDVTAARELQRNLRESERQLVVRERYLQAVLESMPECIKVLGRSGEVLEMNRAGLQMIEADTPEQVIGNSVYGLIDEADREAFRRVNEGVFKGGEGGTVEFGITTLRGVRRVLESRVVPLRDERDFVIGALSTTSDITSRKHSEEALRASEARFRAAVSAVSSLIWTNNAEGQMEGPQPGWGAFTGQSYEEYQGYGWAAAVHPEDAQATIDAWQKSVAARSMFVFEHRIRRHDGVYRLFAIRAVPILDEHNNITEWVGVHNDITDERQLMDERAAALKREQEARTTAELLNRVGPLLAGELDIQVLTQRVTDLATQLTRAQFGSLFHNVVDDQGERYTLYTLSGVPREAFANFPMPRNTKVFAPTFSGEGVVRSDDITADPRYGQNAPHHGMPKGHLPVRSYLAAPVVSRSGEVLGGLFFGHSERGVFTQRDEDLVTGIAAQAAIAMDNALLFKQSQRAAEALAQSNDELRRANADLEQFAFSASHDLQEPLRMVALYTQLLRKKYRERLDSAADEYIDFITSGALRMQQLVSDLLSFTRLTRGPQPPVAMVDANAALDRTLADLAAAIEESGAVITRSGLPRVRIVELHLEQLFQNLVGNAIKYRGPEQPAIHVSAERREGEWLFSVKDNGIGIERKYARHIFGIFRRLHNATEYSGTGIGLAICERIVQRYGGRIWVESEPGRGSTFFFTIPETVGGERNQA